MFVFLYSYLEIALYRLYVFVSKDNKIVVNGSAISLTRYMNQYHKRDGDTNEHNGYHYFTYNGVLIYDMWQSLVRTK